MDQPTSRELSRPFALLMGVQHLCVMFGATVLVPRLTGLDAGVALFASGAGTLVFHLVTRWRVPVYLGSSFAFIPAILAISRQGSLAQACGAIAVAGLVYVAVSILAGVVSRDRIVRVLPAHVTGPMIILIGLMLAPVAVRSADGTDAPDIVARIGKSGCLLIACVTFLTGVIVKVRGSRLGLGPIASLPILAALIVGYLTSIVAGVVSFDAIRSAAWIGLPRFAAPEFGMSAISIAVPIAIVTVVEHLGDVVAIGRVVGKDFVRDPGLHRTLLGDGIATTLSALIGGPANTTYSENTGTLALTGVHAPVVMRIAATLAIALSFVPKIGAVIGAIPAPVVGGVSILLFGMIASIGIRTMIEARVDLSSPRTLIVTSAILVLGLGDAQFEIGDVELSGLGLAAIVGIGLNLALGLLGDGDDA